MPDLSEPDFDPDEQELAELLTDYADRANRGEALELEQACACLLYTSPSPRDLSTSRMPSSA